ncbi:interleukin-1 receptor type 2-like isoform X2 [Cololabis saira]|uniref:interleukin-1 receptor type 2-like isoform X2 n=1 Tax=Cololabis saira TaxID=129043 RepID=UPI002AD227E1|nr:interleukin-1 receptor type 2-like isoform X2 [Cololabis saira]
MVLLIFVLTLIAGACPLMVKEKYVKAGDMLVLYCGEKQCKNGDSVTVWKKDTDQETFLFNTSAAEQKHMGILVFGNCFMVLNASANHQGNYSCDSRRLGRKTSKHMEFMVTVYTAQSKQYEERNQYPITCYKQHSCTLDCPHDLAEDAPNIIKRPIMWHKDGKTSPSYFPSVEDKDSGVYTCKRSYLYSGQMYNMTFAVPLTVKQETVRKCSKITSPQDGQVYPVELGSIVEIHCEAITSSCDVLLFWLSNASFVDDDNQSRVFYRESCNTDTKRMTASLVIRDVSEEDLSKRYECKLQCDSQPSQWTTITLTQKVYPSHSWMAGCAVILIVVMVVAVVICLQFKVDIILFLRNTLGWRRSTSGPQGRDKAQVL